MEKVYSQVLIFTEDRVDFWKFTSNTNERRETVTDRDSEILTSCRVTVCKFFEIVSEMDSFWKIGLIFEMLE